MTTCFALPTTVIATASTPHRRLNLNTRKKNSIDGFKVSCSFAGEDDENEAFKTQKALILDRRNMLLGLGGLYGGVQSALAVPIVAPTDLSPCQDANEGFIDPANTPRGKTCCPPKPKNPVKDFIFPKVETIRVRPAAHRLTDENLEKYKAAIKAMRALPDDHPHSFVAQARVHCAYCNGGYTQIASGFPKKELQIHNSWLFFPFHRWYMYFHERILGKLINDPSFALPYWDWDNPIGMTIPPVFQVQDSPLFDANRNPAHLPPAVVDLNYDEPEVIRTCTEQVQVNLTMMYKQMISNAQDAVSFFGGAYRGGDDPIDRTDPSVGSVEAGCHTAVHRWVGDPNNPNNEDMGNFYSAGYDPLFYAHHANCDRMWKIWKDLGIRGHKEPTDPDWLNASYEFYDENEELVRVYNKDCVNIDKLGYAYETTDTPWLKCRPTPKNKKSKVASSPLAGKFKDVKFPVKLDKIVKVVVRRPRGFGRRKKEDEAELLILKGIKFDAEKFVKFDVYVNDKDDVRASTAAESEFAGSFAQLPHNRGDKMIMTSGARFGIRDLLEDIDAEDDDAILVTLVPRSGCEDVTVSQIKIELLAIDD